METSTLAHRDCEILKSKILKHEFALGQNLSDWIRLCIQLRFPAGRPAHLVIQAHEQILAELLEGDKDRAGTAKPGPIQPLIARANRQRLGDPADGYPNVWDEHTNPA